MCSWRSAFFALVTCVLLLEGQSALKSRISPSSLASSQTTSTSDTRQDQVIRSFENSLLKMFGLSSRPRPKRKVHIPEYILELYKQAVAANQEVYSPYEEDELDEDLTSARSTRPRHPLAGTTVRGFYHQDEKDTETTSSKRRNRKKRSLSQSYLDSNHSTWLNFDVSNIQVDEILLGAELKVFRKNHSHPSNESYVPSAKYRIGVYEILQPASKDSEAVSRLIDTRVVDSSQSKWETFDVAPAIERWRRSPHTNRGLHIHVTSPDTHFPSGGHHVRLRRSVTASEDQWVQEQPYLVTYSEDKASREQKSQRTRRGTKSKRKRSRSQQRKRKKDECRRHALYVNFSDVGWDDWIVAPPGYRAYFCQGGCTFPLPEHINATNHAIVQTLVHSVNSQAVPEPCCVPTELSPISMLYLDEHEKVTLKNYQDMVVQGCGCR